MDPIPAYRIRFGRQLLEEGLGPDGLHRRYPGVNWEGAKTWASSPSKSAAILDQEAARDNAPGDEEPALRHVVAQIEGGRRMEMVWEGTDCVEHARIETAAFENKDKDGKPDPYWSIMDYRRTSKGGLDRSEVIVDSGTTTFRRHWVPSGEPSSWDGLLKMYMQTLTLDAP